MISRKIMIAALIAVAVVIVSGVVVVMNNNGVETANDDIEYTVTIKQSNTNEIRLYDANNELVAVTKSGYGVKVPAGDYIIKTYDSAGLIGGRAVTIDGDLKTNGITATINVENIGFVKNEDYTVFADAYNPYVPHSIQLTEGMSLSGLSRFLVLEGDTIRATVTPAGGRVSQGFVFNYQSLTCNAGFSGNIDVTMSKGTDYKITVPGDTSLTVGFKIASFMPFIDIDPIDVSANGGSSTYCFTLGSGLTYNFRISGDGYVTYSGKFTMSESMPDMTVTRSDMYYGSVSQSYVDRDTSSDNSRNVADIMMNISETGEYNFKSVSDTYQLVPIRLFQALGPSDTTSSKNYFIEPDYHYEIIGLDGSPSDLVSIDKNNLMTAKKTGVAIVLVTYDAFTYADYKNGIWVKTLYGSIWSENTGVFVVSVGEKANIDTGMTINEGRNNNGSTIQKLSGDAIDSELDVLYYMKGSGGYRYEFTPESGTTVKVYNPEYDGNTLTGFASGTVINDDGTFTVTLKQGRNIVQMINNGQSSFQVLFAKEVEYTVHNLTSGNNNLFSPGDNIQVTFDQLWNPMIKLAGKYNTVPYIVLVDDIGTLYTGASTSNGNYTWQSDSSNFRSVVITIPEDATDHFVLTGYFLIKGYGDSAGAHRNICIDLGAESNFTAMELDVCLGALPTIDIKLSKTVNLIFDTMVSSGADVNIETTMGISLTKVNPTTLGHIEISPGYGLHIKVSSNSDYNMTGYSKSANDTHIPNWISVTFNDGVMRLDGIVPDDEKGTFSLMIRVTSNDVNKGYVTADITYCGANHTETVVCESGDYIMPDISSIVKAPVGKTFAGWCLNPDMSGTSYGYGDVVKISKDTTFYAKWV